MSPLSRMAEQMATSVTSRRIALIPVQNPEYQIILAQPQTEQTNDNEDAGGGGEDYEHVFVLLGI